MIYLVTYKGTTCVYDSVKEMALCEEVDATNLRARLVEAQKLGKKHYTYRINDAKILFIEPMEDEEYVRYSV